MDKTTSPYIEVSCEIAPERSELLIYHLSELGFESFREEDTNVRAYIPKRLFDQQALDQQLKELNKYFSFQYNIHTIAPTNWNTEWEKNFSPIAIDNRCYIKASFHKSHPGIPHQITINPQQSFGTGHHESTRLMIKSIFWLDEHHGLNEQVILDAGCGTGILSILAEQLKAGKVYAADNNQWAFENTKQNLKLNACKRVHLFLGDILSNRFFHKLEQNVKFDTVFANLSKKLVLAGIPHIAGKMSKTGMFIASGFYTQDKKEVCQKANRYNLHRCASFQENEWTAIVFKKR